MPEKRVTRKSVGVVTSETAHEKREERVVEEVHLVERTATYQSTEERGEQQPQGDDDSFQTTFSQEVSWTETRQGDFVEHYVQNGTIPGCDLAANSYLENCQKYGVQVDAGVVVALKTGWHKLHPTKLFGEGAMLPLLGVLDQNQHIRNLDLADTAMQFRFRGNGNSNARVLNFILRKNQSIEQLDLSNTGLDDDGLKEIAEALKVNKTLKTLKIAGNYFGLDGVRALASSLTTNSSLPITHIDLSRNALSYQAMQTLQCLCGTRGLTLSTQGNYIFEEILNSVSHGVALIFAIIGAIILMTEVTDAHTEYHFYGCLVFSFTLIFLFAVSTLYHSFFMLPTASYVLQVLDHVGIYMLIAGSYTPFLLIGLHHYPSATVLLIAQWIAAACGTMFVIGADFDNPLTSNIELTAFLGMGGSVIFVWHNILEALSTSAIYLLVAGGAAYVTGIVFFIWGISRPIYHSVWHLFVVLGASLHWFAVYFFIVNTRLGGVVEHVLEDCLHGIDDCVKAMQSTTTA